MHPRKYNSCVSTTQTSMTYEEERNVNKACDSPGFPPDNIALSTGSTPQSYTKHRWKQKLSELWKTACTINKSQL